MKRPDLATVPPFYHNYINLTVGGDLNQILEDAQKSINAVLDALPEERWNYRYAEGKWSIKELVQHLIDSERIFTYRALCISRGEHASLPGFDENPYAAASEADRRTKADLTEEFKTVQKATLLLFKSFSEAQLDRWGTANNSRVEVRAIGFLTAGHKLHHKNIIEQRYL